MCGSFYSRYAWWRKQSASQFGLLFPVVRRVLAVPASNSDIERFFSECKVVYADLRSSMAEKTMEKWMMLSYNMEVHISVLHQCNKV